MKKSIVASLIIMVAILITVLVAGCSKQAPAAPPVSSAVPATSSTSTEVAPPAVPPTAPSPAVQSASAAPAVSMPAKSITEQPYTFTTVDFPGANVTQVYGINAGGDIVGMYKNPGAAPASNNQGFVLKSGKYTNLNYPGDGVMSTIATSIGPLGDIGGFYALKSPAPAGNAHGFLLTLNGAWVPVDYNGDGKSHTMTGIYRISPDGTMVGCVHDGNPATVMYGVTFSPNGGGLLSYPDAKPYAMHYGATPNGELVVGTYTSNTTGGFGVGAITHGYLMRNDKVTVFNVPGSIATTAFDINAVGVVVGSYRKEGEGTDKWHGFVLETRNSVDPNDWKFNLQVDFQDAKITRIRGINAGGTIVGDYVGADGKNHGFAASRTQK